MNASTPPSPASSFEPPPARFRVFGVGGAGGRVAELLARTGLEGAFFAALNTDAAALQSCEVAWRLQLGARLTRGLGAGGDPDVGRAAAEEAAPAIRELCRGAEVIFILSGLGGGTGTGAAPVVAQLAKEAGALVLGLVTLPFACEGARRQRQAQHGLVDLKGVADAVLCLPSQRVLSLIDESTPLVETFQFTDALLAQGVRGVWRLTSQPGLINVDFADLRALVRDGHAESYFACAEAEGEQRARDVVERLLLSPLLENGALLRETPSALVSVVAGPNLTLAEVNRIMDRLQRECEGGALLLGATIDKGLGDRLSLTLIGTRPRAGSPEGGEPVVAEERLPARRRPSVPESETVETDFFRRQAPPRRPRSKYVPPPPELTPEQREQALARTRRGRSRMQQAMLPLEIVSKGRFEKSEPTIYRGEDLDVPTFVRRGMVLN